MLKILGSVLILTASVGGCLTFLERFREEELTAFSDERNADHL